MIRSEILLTSETFVREVTNVSDNLAGKFLISSIREAQEVGLRQILGGCLLDKLKHLVETDTIAGTVYEDILDRCQYFLAYSTLVEVVMKVSYKVDNFGVSRTTDENQTFASFDEVAKQQYYFQAKADSCAAGLQRWLLDNAKDIPELDECACNRVRANLQSSASCGVWLGGPRGYRKPDGGCCR